MNDLQVIQNNGVEVVDSRAVAEMIGKNTRNCCGTSETMLKSLKIPLSAILR